MTTIWHRYLVNNAESLESLRRLAKFLIELSEQRTGNILSLHINRSANVTKGIDMEIAEVSRDLFEHGIGVTINPAIGAGMAMFNTLFSWPQDKSGINILLDGDQWDVSRKEVIDAVGKLSDMMARGKFLLGLGARDRVILGVGETDTIRQVEEMYFAKFMHPKIVLDNPIGISTEKVPTGYRKYGDPVPGFYAINTAHPKFAELHAAILHAISIPEIAKWCGDPYMVMKASTLTDRIASVYAPIIDNPPGTHDLDALRRKTATFVKTELKGRWVGILNDRSFESELEGLYPHAAVSKARELMLAGAL